LKDQYNTIIGGSELFQWAKPPKDDAEDQKQDDLIEDPIAKLLQSNTKIFSKSEQILRPGKLKF
jgi:hypothetical protein